MGSCKRKGATKNERIAQLLSDCIKRGNSILTGTSVDADNLTTWSTEVKGYISEVYGPDSKEVIRFDHIGWVYILNGTEDSTWWEAQRRDELNKKIAWLNGIHACLSNGVGMPAQGPDNQPELPVKGSWGWLRNNVPLSLVITLIAGAVAIFGAGVKVGTMPAIVKFLTDIGFLGK